MSKVLIKWEDNWADEMDIVGFQIMEDKEWKAMKAALEDVENEFTVCIGTNEEIDYKNGQALLDTLTVKKLSTEEYKTIKRLFGEEFGFTQFTYASEDVLKEEEEF